MANPLSPTRTFFGRGELTRGEHRVAVAYSLTGAPYDPGEDWRLEVHGAGPDATDWEPVFRHGTAPLQLRGVAQDGRTLVLPDIQAEEYSGSRLVAAVWDVRIGEGGETMPPDPPAEQHVTVYLTPTPMALPSPDGLMRSFTGELTAGETDHRDRPPVEVGTAIGKARLQLTYAWEKAELGDVRADVRIPTPTLLIQVERGPAAIHPYPLMEAVGDALSDTLDVLSLLSRRFVRWTRMSLRSYWLNDDRPRDRRDTEWMRTIGLSREARDQRELVNARRMPPGALNDLVATYGADPRKHALRAALTYCLVSYESRALETSFMGAFTALEALYGASTDDGPVSPECEAHVDYDELHARLTGAVVAYTHGLNLPGATTEALVARIGDLRPRPRHTLKRGEQISEMIRSTAVRWDDLWPAGTVLVRAMRRAFDRRNHFYHRGHFPDPETAMVDANRLRMLCDRVLLARIGVDSDWQAHQWDDESRARRLAAHPA